MPKTHLQKIVFKSEKAIARWVTSGNPRDFYWAKRWLIARLGRDACGHIEMMLTIIRRALREQFTESQSRPTITPVLPSSGDKRCMWKKCTEDGAFWHTDPDDPSRKDLYLCPDHSDMHLRDLLDEVGESK